jgi:hypothetical protein
MAECAAPAPLGAPEVRSYLYVLACRTAGDPAEYDEFTARQERAGCAAACRLQRDSRAVEAVLAHVQALLRRLQQARQTRVVGLCAALRELPALPTSRVLFWSLCSLTGLPTQDSLRVETPATALFVDRRFAAFVQSYWLVQHMPELETARMQSFLAQMPEDSTPAAQIQEYTGSAHAASDAELGVYARALHFVVDSLQATLDGLG